MADRPQIVFLNQSLDQSFLQMAAEIAETAGKCTLYTGSYESSRRGNLRIQHAPPYRNASELSRLWTWGMYLVYVTWVCLFTSGKPLLFVGTNPPFLLFLAHLLYHLRGWKYIVLVWDIYPDVLVRFGRLSEQNPIVKVWRWLNRNSLAKAQAVITISQDMARTLQAELERDDSAHRYANIRVIPNWVDTDHVRPIPKSENWFAQQYQQVEKLTVLYSGNMGATHDLDALIKAAKRLCGMDDIAFLLIGNGPGYKAVEGAVAQQNLSNVTLLSRQPQEVVSFSMSTGDVGVVSLDRGAEGLSMPSKTYFMLAAGCALIGVSQTRSGLAQLIEEHRVGVNVVPGDVESLVAAILRFHQDRAYLRQCQINARNIATRYFSAEKAIQEYKALLLPALRSEEQR
jgi:glycosyltransferase involved in cell wall biosynthesis